MATVIVATPKVDVLAVGHEPVLVYVLEPPTVVVRLVLVELAQPFSVTLRVLATEEPTEPP